MTTIRFPDPSGAGNPWGYAVRQARAVMSLVAGRRVLGPGRSVRPATCRPKQQRGAPWRLALMATLALLPWLVVDSTYARPWYVPVSELWPRWTQHDPRDTRRIDHGAGQVPARLSRRVPSLRSQSCALS
jgi:hypothetical protein